MNHASVSIALMSMALLLGGCDEPVPQIEDESPAPVSAADAVEAELEPGKTAASLRLGAVVELVKGNEAGDAKTLEAKINDPELGLHAVDLDEDGVTDFVEVIESKEGDKVVLKLRALPSTKKGKSAKKHGVVIATIELHIEGKEKVVVHGEYTEHIDHDVSVHVYHHEEPVVYEHGVVVFEEGCFFHYAFVFEHEYYHGHFGHIVVVPAIHHDIHIHHKHKKHKKHKHKHKHKHGHGW